METIHRINPVRGRISAWRRASESIALIPTMGNLHLGHQRLVEVGQSLAQRAVVSIFVNPTQFAPNEDFHSYPRTLEQDSYRLAKLNLDVLFVPNTVEIYPHGLEHTTRVEVPGLSTMLCGASRPGHFSGVATVVTKLLNIVQPNIALFGEKDWQQLVLIRRLVRELDVPVEIVAVPTVREADGLAMSSRNTYLSPGDREIAPTLYMTLQKAAARLLAGERDYAAVETAAISALQAAGLRPDYFAIRRADDLQEPRLEDKELRILAAAWLGSTRLIDNCPVTMPVS